MCGRGEASRHTHGGREGCSWTPRKINNQITKRSGCGVDALAPPTLPAPSFCCTTVQVLLQASCARDPETPAGRCIFSVFVALIIIIIIKATPPLILAPLYEGNPDRLGVPKTVWVVVGTPNRSHTAQQQW